MKFVTGTFKGNYKGKEVESLSLQTISALHYLNIDPGATMHSCEWINDYNNLEITQPFIRIHSVSNTDFHFNNDKLPAEKAFRDNLHSCILIDPIIHSITRKGGYTFGTIEGKLLGTIGNSNIATASVELKDDNTIPSSIVAASPLRGAVLHKETSAWNWSRLFVALFWLALGIGILSWLISHRGCKRIADSNDIDLTRTDSVAVKNNNDTVNLKNGNMTFSVYDWSVEDNDTISLLLNGKLIRSDIPLTNSIVSWIEPALSPGDNILTIKSVNNGTIGPASPTIEINDGNNNQAFQIRVYKGEPKKIHLYISK